MSTMNPTRLVNPFGRGSPDLSKKRVTILETTWLCHEVKFHGKTASELGAKYSLNRKMITQWVSDYTKNGNLQQSRGRPSSFLSADLEYIKKSVSAKVYNTTAVDFRTQMQEEYVKSVISVTGVADCSVKSLSDRTLVRYTKK